MSTVGLMVTDREPDVPALPAASVAVAVIAEDPAAVGNSPALKTAFHTPAGSTTTDLVAVPHWTFSVAPASLVPLTVTADCCSVGLITSSPVTLSMVGAAGPAVSTVMSRVAGSLTLAVPDLAVAEIPTCAASAGTSLDA